MYILEFSYFYHTFLATPEHCLLALGLTVIPLSDSSKIMLTCVDEPLGLFTRILKRQDTIFQITELPIY